MLYYTVVRHLMNKLTTCSGVLHENLKVPLLTKEFPSFYGTRQFITMLTTAFHLLTY